MPNITVRGKFEHDASITAMAVWIIKRRRHEHHGRAVRAELKRTKDGDGYYRVTVDKPTWDDATEKVVAKIAGIDSNGRVKALMTKVVPV